MDQFNSLIVATLPLARHFVLSKNCHNNIAYFVFVSFMKRKTSAKFSWNGRCRMEEGLQEFFAAKFLMKSKNWPKLDRDSSQKKLFETFLFLSFGQNSLFLRQSLFLFLAMWAFKICT